jgi:hypothetical protein
MSFALIIPYLEIQRPNWIESNFVENPPAVPSHVTGLVAIRSLFLAWLFLQNTTRSDFREF